MAQLSPSSTKVDEFLSSLSQISQDRLRENHKRQRELQRDIDELRRTSPVHHNEHGITELKFNRSARGAFYEKWKDSPPDLPTRPSDSPPMPERPKPERPVKYGTKSSLDALKQDKREKPERPKKPEWPEKPEKPPKLPTRPLEFEEAVVKIAKPVARVPEKATSKPVINIPHYSARPKDLEGAGEVRSFGDLEKQIQAGSRAYKPEISKPEIVSKHEVSKSTPLEPLGVSTSKPVSRPLVPSKPKELKEGKELESKFPVKPVKPSFGANKPGTFKPDAKSDFNPKPDIKPAKPAKLSFKSFQEQDTQELKQQIQRLSPTKSAPISERKALTDAKPVGISPLRPVKRSEPEVLKIPEALNALAKLKPAKPTKPAKPEKPEKPAKAKSPQPTKVGISQLSESKSSGPVKPRTNSSLSTPTDSAALTDKQPDFRARLANVLRANTDPTVKAASQVESVRRTQSATTSTKLTHPNKTRAKGPKRKLPKQLGSAPVSAPASISASTSAFTSPSSPPKMAISSPANKSTSSHGDQHNLQNQQNTVEPKKKTPPPIKPKKPVLQPRQKRVVSGDLFL